MPDIQLIPVDLIDPHPSNPRHDLGDLTELATSIKAQGVRQNLLLVPAGDRYRAVIGHRRLAASRLAGLTGVPAAVDPDLTEVDQVELMVVENVQRRDLSAIEEAECYQQLLDLGVKVTAIARRTGRARSTIDARLKLLALPEPAREKVHARQLSLEDAAAIGEFDDDETVIRLMRAAGTPNWRWELQNARDRRRKREARKPIIDKLSAMGFETLPSDAVTWRDYQVVETFQQADEIGDADEYPTDAMYEPDGSSAYVSLWLPKLDGDERAAQDAEQQAERDRVRAQRDADQAEGEQALALRDQFVLDTVARGLTGPERAAITAAFADATLQRSHWSTWDLDRALGFDTAQSTVAQWRTRFPKAMPEHILLAQLHAGLRNPYAWPDIDPDLADFYGLLEQLGHEISDAERDRLTSPPEDPDVREPDAAEPIAS